MYFQDIISNLQSFWKEEGCNIFHSFNHEIGAGTFHPFSMLKSLCFSNWRVAYIQYCVRPNDSYYGNNIIKSSCYYQFQVFIKPSPNDLKYKCLRSLSILGITNDLYHIKFINSDWENPTLGACGIGWELLCNGVEVIQFTYMQKIGNILCNVISGEVTYGLERIAMYLQNKRNIWNLIWGYENITYKELFLFQEKEFCILNSHASDIDFLVDCFCKYEKQFYRVIKKNLFYPAYNLCVQLSHVFNLLESRKILSNKERYSYISRIRKTISKCCNKFLVNFSI